MINEYKKFSMSRFKDEPAMWLEAAEEEAENIEAGKDAEPETGEKETDAEEKSPVDQIEELLDSDAFSDCSDECKEAIKEIKKLLKKIEE